MCMQIFDFCAMMLCSRTCRWTIPATKKVARTRGARGRNASARGNHIERGRDRADDLEKVSLSTNVKQQLRKESHDTG